MDGHEHDEPLHAWRQRDRLLAGVEERTSRAAGASAARLRSGLARSAALPRDAGRR